MLLLADDSGTQDRVEAELRKRYGADYQVIKAGSANAALGVLGELSDSGRQVSLVLADQWLSGASGTELLARVRQLHPGARRVLLITWGDQARVEPMLQATILGDIDAYVVKPGPPPDERFHRFITEQLDEWGRSNLPGLEVVRVVGEEWSARSHELRELLGRNGVPFGFYSADSPDGQRLVGESWAAQNDLPAVVLYDGRVLADPSNSQVGEAIGVQTKPGAGRYDVTVIGAGPAGLAAAVYSASEGLSTVILEPEAIGGQAGTSSLIRNYLGFPTGVSGGDLAVRAYTQAWNFGAEYVYGSSATGLRAGGSQLTVTLAGGSEVCSRAVIVATGMAYRRLAIPALDALTGAGVFYGAAATEARAMKDREVFVVGGANSAGQAAVHLARYAAQVTVLVRGQSLADTMSDYLIREIESAPNIAVRYKVAVTDGAGRSRLESLTLIDLQTGAAETVAAAALFVLIGAEPRTQWLPATVRRDQPGFVLTGNDLLENGRPQADWPLQRMPMFLESSLPGVFAVGDVRHGSVKRVASAVGEGSIAIRLVHDHLGAG
ncbi:MAG TPA: FAD-dependent oxidoreductase [Streptosporangiaceae bacterium]|nr:FAD-dependent oxidoreductase [Streptosporangiaceae bacterium]